MTKVHHREGFWKCYHRLRNTGNNVNHNKLHRIYKQMGMLLRRKVKKRLPARVKEPLLVPGKFNQTWSIDFVSDALSNGVKFKSFNVIDDYNREVLFIETDYSLKSSRVIWVLKHLVNRCGKPENIRMDNGPELVAKIAQNMERNERNKISVYTTRETHSKSYIERFNKTYRESVLDAYLFDNLDEVREVSQEFVDDYNNHRPHDALGDISPRKYRELMSGSSNPFDGLRFATLHPSKGLFNKKKIVYF